MKKQSNYVQVGKFKGMLGKTTVSKPSHKLSDKGEKIPVFVNCSKHNLSDDYSKCKDCRWEVPPNQNKQNKWEEEFMDKFCYLYQYCLDGGMGNQDPRKEGVKLKQFISTLLTKELASQKHDYEILVNTILDKHIADVGKMVKRIEKAIPQNYRENIDPKKEWEKGKHGDNVKYYGQGYNQAISEIRSALKIIYQRFA